MSRFAYTTYEKILLELRNCLRGDDYNLNHFLRKTIVIDETIIDMCPIVDHHEKQHFKKFTFE